MDEQCDNRNTRPDRSMEILFLVVAAGVLVRGWILFNTASMPGVNGAYSLVQARSLLEKGTLGLPDFPLLFALQAGFASLIQHVTGLGFEPSIVLAVKLLLALLPPLAAVPVFLLGRKWSVRAGCPRSPIPLVAAALVSLGGQAVVMTGDIDKNALALVWLLGLLLSLHASMERRRLGSLAAPTLFLLLLGVTHVGAFGAALVVTACIGAVYLKQPGAPPLKRALPAIAGALAFIGAAEALVFWNFDPARIERLLRVITNPLFFLSHRPGAVPPMAPPMPPMHDGPPFMPFVVMLAQLLLLGALGAWVLRVVWRRRHELTGADISLVCGCVLAIALMTGPWIQGDSAIRLVLIAAPLAVVVGSFTLLHNGGRRPGRILAGLACLALLAAGAFQTVTGGWRLFGGGAYEELKSLSAQIPHPDHTLIVANHGIEWNAAWLLHTHVAQNSALGDSDWQRYDAVLFLVMKDAFAPGGPPGFGGPGRPGPGPNPQSGPPPPPPPPMHRPVKIPADAVILHDGPHFTLARVDAPPPPEKAGRQAGNDQGDST